MSDRHNRSGHDDERDDDTFGADDVNRFADAFKRTTKDAFSKAELGQTKDFFGLGKIDAGLADMLEGGYNVGADLVLSSSQPKIFKFVESKAQSLLKLEAGSAKTAAVVATIASNIAARSAAYVGPLLRGMSNQYKQRVEFAKDASTVLDDIKGHHSLAALYMTSAKDNTVIYAHRKRLSEMGNSQNLTNATDLAINSGTSLVLDGKNIMHMWKNKTPYFAPEQPIVHDANAGHGGHAQHTINSWESFKTVARGILPQIAKRFAATNEYKLKKELQPYSAWEMINELAEETDSNPKASGFSMPRSFQKPHARREQASLEEYLMRICIVHQKEMSYLDPKHTEIREALSNDLAAAVKPIAAAIRKGDFKVLDMVHLVGEGKLIKNHGRAIASVDEVTALVKRNAPAKSAHKNSSKDAQPSSTVGERVLVDKKEHAKLQERADDDEQMDHAERESSRRAKAHHAHAQIN